MLVLFPAFKPVRAARAVAGGFDSHPFPPVTFSYNVGLLDLGRNFYA